MATNAATTTQDQTFLQAFEVTPSVVYTTVTQVVPPPDPVRPVVTIVSPTPGTIITPTTPLVIQVTDNLNSFRRILVVARFPGLRLTELVYDGENFTEAYTTTSGISVITNGYQFSLLRNAAWPDSPTVRVYAIDTTGNENL